MLQPLLLLTAICARPLLAQNTTGVNLTSSLASFANLKWTTYFLDVYDIEDNVSPDSGSVLLAPTDAGWQSFYNSGAGQAIFGDSLNNVTDEDALVNLMSYHFIIDEDFSDAVNGVRGNLSVDNVTSMLPTGLSNNDTGDSLFVTYIQTDGTGKYSASFLSAAGMLSNVYSSYLHGPVDELYFYEVTDVLIPPYNATATAKQLGATSWLNAVRNATVDLADFQDVTSNGCDDGEDDANDGTYGSYCDNGDGSNDNNTTIDLGTLVDILDNEPYTILVPNGDAFTSDYATNVAPLNNTLRAAHLEYYILEGRLLINTGSATAIPAADGVTVLRNGREYSSLASPGLVVYTANTTGSYINSARIVTANIPLTNGVMHVIDAPLVFDTALLGNDGTPPPAGASPSAVSLLSTSTLAPVLASTAVTSGVYGASTARTAPSGGAGGLTVSVVSGSSASATSATTASSSAVVVSPLTTTAMSMGTSTASSSVSAAVSPSSSRTATAQGARATAVLGLAVLGAGAAALMV